MDEIKVFKENELDGIPQPELLQKATSIKQRFDYRRAYYHSLRNTITDLALWSELNDKLIEFDKLKFAPFNQKWATVHRTPNLNAFKDYFNEGNKLFSELEEIISVVKPTYLNSEEVERLKTEVLVKVEQDVLALKLDVITEVNKGINNLLELKAELGLHKNFADNISTEKAKNAKLSNRFLISFISSLVIIAAMLIGSFFIDQLKSWDLANRIAVKFAITLPLGFLSYFFFTQYKLYQIIAIKLSHLHGFLGGGATYIGQLIDQDTEAKKEVSKNLAQMFMDIEDILTNVKSVKHPSQETVDSISKKVGELTGSLNELLKTVKEIKN